MSVWLRHSAVRRRISFGKLRSDITGIFPPEIGERTRDGEIALCLLLPCPSQGNINKVLDLISQDQAPTKQVGQRSQAYGSAERLIVRFRKNNLNMLVNLLLYYIYMYVSKGTVDSIIPWVSSGPYYRGSNNRRYWTKGKIITRSGIVYVYSHYTIDVFRIPIKSGLVYVVSYKC